LEQLKKMFEKSMPSMPMPIESEQRDLIVSAASDLFSRFGLEKTTVGDIARAAKKGKSSLYYYFRNKEEVFAEVIKGEIAGLKARIIQAVDQEDDPCEKLRKFVFTRLDYLYEKADQYITVKDEYLKHYAFIENLTLDYSQWEVATIRDIVEYGQKKGAFLLTDPGAVSQAVFFALKGLEYPWAVNLGRTEIEENVEMLVNIILEGISKGQVSVL